MKKVYIMPLAEVVKTETEEMICQSLPTKKSYEDGIKLLENDDFENVFENLW